MNNNSCCEATSNWTEHVQVDRSPKRLDGVDAKRVYRRTRECFRYICDFEVNRSVELNFRVLVVADPPFRPEENRLNVYIPVDNRWFCFCFSVFCVRAHTHRVCFLCEFVCRR